MDRDDATMIVAHNIAALIARQGTNAAEVARRAGLSPTGVYDILSGKSRNPRLDTIHKIAFKGFGVPLAAMFQAPDTASVEAEVLACLAEMPAADRERFALMARAFATATSAL